MDIEKLRKTSKPPMFRGSENSPTLDEYLEYIEMYHKANEAYYRNGESIMSDAEFDSLKEEIEDSPFRYILEEVEPESKDSRKLEGESEMISLSKTQVFGDEFEESHLDSVMDWLKEFDSNITYDTKITISRKWDGVALRLDYEDGMLVEARTRGNFSVLNKLKPILPMAMEVGYSGQIRCEVIMSSSIFKKKYMNDYQNARNLVSGVMNDDSLDDPRVQDLTLMILNDGVIPIDVEDFNIFGFNNFNNCDYQSIDYCTIEDIPGYYKCLKDSRSSLKYATDGLVVTLRDVVNPRNKSKYPLYARAIKFPPKKITTKVLDITWRLNKVGEWIPKLIMEPVDIDGSTVKQCLAFNYGWVIENKVYPDAIVEIAKNGDIIPYVQRVITSGDKCKFNYPGDMFDPGVLTKIEGIHLMNTDEEKNNQERFITGCMSLKFLGISRKTYEKIGLTLNWDVINLFDNQLLNEIGERNIIGQAMYSKLRGYINNKEKSLTMFDLISMLQFNQCGVSTSQAMADRMNGLEWRSSGLEKDIINKFDESGEYRVICENSIKRLKEFGVDILESQEEESQEKEYIIYYIMTGSPTNFGYNNKKDFSNSHPDWKEMKNIVKMDDNKVYLVTDDLDSTTSKMKKAKSLGIKIIDYKMADEIYKNNS